MLTRDVRNGTAWLTLDRPDKLNAMPRGFFAELSATMAELERADEVRVVVVHGAGRCFSVGGDIDDFGNIGGVEDRRAYMREALGAFKAVEQLPKPVIAAVHGHALGGGCELTLACDIVVADETASFGMPEAAVGLVPGFAAVRGLSHLNQHWMKYLVMTGLPITAKEAYIAGLVQRVTTPGGHIEEAEQLARAIASRSRLALAAGKEVLSRHNGDGYGYAAEMVALLQGGDDFAEGMGGICRETSAVLSMSTTVSAQVAGSAPLDRITLAEDVLPLGQLLLRSARRHAAREAVVFPDLRVTYRELADRAWSVARSLTALGVRPREHVGLLMTNHVDLVASLFDATLIGAVAVPVNPRIAPPSWGSSSATPTSSSC